MGFASLLQFSTQVVVAVTLNVTGTLTLLAPDALN
jgi:hypothetical protein